MAITSFQALNSSPLTVQVTDRQGTIGAGGKITFRNPVGPTFYRQYLRFTIAGVAATEAQIIAQISNIVIKMGADQKIEMSGREAIYYAAHYTAQKTANFTGAVGTFIQNGIVPIAYAREWLASVQNREASAYGTLGQNSFQIEITFAGAGVTIDDVTLSSEIGAGAELGRHITLRKTQVNLGVVGINDVTNISRDPLTDLYALHLGKADGTAHAITHVEVLAERSKIVDNSTQEIMERSQKLGLYNQYDPSILTIPFTARHRDSDALPMNMQEILIRITTTAAASYNVIQERAEVEPARGV